MRQRKPRYTHFANVYRGKRFSRCAGKLSEMEENALSIDIGWQPRVVIGRFDLKRSDAPDISLDFLDAAEKGVSRRHAAFFWRNRVLCIEDLGSTNGTSVNGKKLHPRVPHVLGDGDEVQLGSLRLRLRLDPNRSTCLTQ